jgi:hypothetical protein
VWPGERDGVLKEKQAAHLLQKRPGPTQQTSTHP